MKRIVLVTVLILAGVSTFAQTGFVRELSGTVEIKTSGAVAYMPAVSGMEVRQDTLISTGFKSMALIEMGSTIIAVRPLTRLSITEIQAIAGTETINVNLQAGRVRVDVNPPAGTKASMSVQSPIATASVRGTGFEMDTHYIYVDDGTVYFKGNNGYTIRVEAGSFSSVGKYKKANAPIIASKTGFAPPMPLGYDPNAGHTGGGGKTSGSEGGDSPSGPSNPSGPSTPSSPGGSGPSGSGPGSSGPGGSGSGDGLSLPLSW